MIKNTQEGGGVKSNLKNTTSVFRPLIASSLALALGISVGNSQAISGNITDDGSYDSTTDQTANINLSTSGTATVNLTNGAVLTGTITADSDKQKQTKNVVTFEGAQQADKVVLIGNIESSGTAKANYDYDETYGNHITFTAGSMQGNITANLTGINQSPGYNDVTFTNGKLIGSISALGGSKNKVTFSANSSISGGITAQGGVSSKNEIIFSGEGESTIGGKVYAYGGNGANWNSITADKSTKLIINQVAAEGGRGVDG